MAATQNIYWRLPFKLRVQVCEKISARPLDRVRHHDLVNLVTKRLSQSGTCCAKLDKVADGKWSGTGHESRFLLDSCPILANTLVTRRVT